MNYFSPEAFQNGFNAAYEKLQKQQTDNLEQAHELILAGRVVDGLTMLEAVDADLLPRTEQNVARLAEIEVAMKP